MIKVNVHKPSALLPNISEVIVDPEVGMLHHYRAEPMESFIKHPNQYRYVQDSIMLRYSDALETAVLERQMQIGYTDDS